MISVSNKQMMPGIASAMTFRIKFISLIITAGMAFCRIRQTIREIYPEAKILYN